MNKNLYVHAARINIVHTASGGLFLPYCAQATQPLSKFVTVAGRWQRFFCL